MSEKRKSILILMPSMPRGGTEISLLNFLHFLDYGKYDVTLLFMQQAGELLCKLPPQVKCQEISWDSPYDLSVAQQKVHVPRWYGLLHRVVMKINRTFHRIVVSLPPYGFSKALAHCSVPEEEYDLAIDYHGFGSFTGALLAEKIRARKKVQVIHGENLSGMARLRRYIRKLDMILGVTHSCIEKVKTLFPTLRCDYRLFKNLLDWEDIRSKASAPIGADALTVNSRLKLCTVGRIEYEKGFDIAIDCGKILKEGGIAFQWVFVGDGSLKVPLEAKVKAYGLGDSILFVGMKGNPYPYMRWADLYVQPSRNEGYGLAIEEALCVGTPVVASRLDCIAEHVEDDVVGRLVDVSAECFAKAIQEAVADNSLHRWRDFVAQNRCFSSQDNEKYIDSLLTEMMQ